MMKYRKKPVIIEAFRFGHEKPLQWFANSDKCIVAVSPLKVCAYIDTLEGRMTAENGDYIIQGIKGEIYPVKYDIFMQSYEPCELVIE